MVELMNISGLIGTAISFLAGMVVSTVLMVTRYHYSDYIDKKNEVNSKVFSPLLAEIHDVLKDELPTEGGNDQSLGGYYSDWEDVEPYLKSRVNDKTKDCLDVYVNLLHEFGELEKEIDDLYSYDESYATSWFSFFKYFHSEFVKSNNPTELRKRLKTSVEESSRKDLPDMIENLEEEYGTKWPNVLYQKTTDRKNTLADFVQEKEPIEQLLDNIQRRRRKYSLIQSQAEMCEGLIKQEMNRYTISFVLNSSWSKFREKLPNIPLSDNISARISNWNINRQK